MRIRALPALLLSWWGASQRAAPADAETALEDKLRALAQPILMEINSPARQSNIIADAGALR